MGKIKIKSRGKIRGSHVHRVYSAIFPDGTKHEEITETDLMDELRKYPGGCRIEFQGGSEGDKVRFQRAYNS